VLFRAAGIGGRCEMHALVTPTTKGFRQTLTNNDVEFTQPLKEKTSENSLEMQENEDEDEMEFLESLGVDSSDIKFKEDVKKKAKAVEDDNGDLSTILIEGVDCQAFYNFLLCNAKTTVPAVGRLAGVPPTIIGPVAFLGGTLRKQTMRTSKLKLEGEDFSSIELRGAVLPHIVHTICDLLADIKDKFSLTLANYPHTVAFSKTSRRMLEDLDASRAAADHVFGRENLSDCGIQNKILEGLCRVEGEAVMIQERIQYDKDVGGYLLF
jgi:protein downstream neighbor of Son